MIRPFRTGRYASVTSTLALVVALGGTSYAAATISGQDIRNGTVANIDLAANAVTSAKVRNGSLQKADFAPGQLPAGAPGATGAGGATGDAGATGTAGATGARGPKGDDGAAGPQGPAGSNGAQGAQGAPGAQGQQGLQGSQGLQGPAGSDAIPNAGMTFQQAPLTTSSTTFGELVNLTQTVTVPAGQQRRLIATFSAESACTGAVSDGWCTVRITVDGDELNPNTTDNDFAFDSTDNGSEGAASFESHSMQRFSGNLSAGSHTVRVEARVTPSADLLRLDDAVLTTLLVAPSE